MEKLHRDSVFNTPSLKLMCWYTRHVVYAITYFCNTLNNNKLNFLFINNQQLLTNKNQINMSALTKFALSTEAQNMNIVGQLKTILKEYKEDVRETTNGIIVSNGKEQVYIGFSKKVQFALKSGELEAGSLGNLNVVEGMNAAGEPRLYLAFGAGAGTVLDAAAIIKAAGKEEAPVVNRKSIFAEAGFSL